MSSTATYTKKSLGHSIKRRAVSLAQAQNTYKQNVVTVNTLINSVLTSSLPTLNQNPPDWSAFTTAYEQANSDALDWVNNVMARLLSVPNEVQSYNTIVTQLLQDAKNQATILVSNPGNAAAKAALTQDLNGLSTQFNIVVTFISGAVTNIQKFQDVLPNMATQLQTIATKSTQDANADQAKIDQLKADIAKLQSDIQSLTASIVALGIADAAALTLGVVATIAAWPFGAVVWLVLGPAVAVATTYIALDAVQIKNDKAKIESDQQQITGITADVATLHILSQTYSSMSAQATQLQQNLQAILTEWQTLESDVNADIADIKAAISDSQAPNYQAVVNDINDAISEWTAAYAQAGALYLDLNVNNAQLGVGMSSSEVQSRLASGVSTSIIEYFNSLSH
ncbi:MAG TPA: hypothetical protein VG820_01910 [Fimbriimonadaceae bacterium]|nr:hypothetical protein [Fimbriimonadaceae bacterium]